MCEILVRLQNGSNPDPGVNPLRGYIVCLRPDGHQWGLAEVPRLRLPPAASPTFLEP